MNDFIHESNDCCAENSLEVAPEQNSLWGELEESWRPVDNDEVLDGHPPPGPSLFTRTDGVSLFYPGLVHALIGEPEGMKSWAWQVCAVQELRQGTAVLVLDFENHARTVLPRIRALGITREEFSGLSYVQPTNPLAWSYSSFLAFIEAAGFGLVVIDGVTDAMALHDLDADRSNTDAAKFDRHLLKPIAALGPAVVVTDHVTKERDSRGRYAIGAQHKLAAITGAQYQLTVKQPFGRGLHGIAQISLQKDKPGELSPFALGKGRHIADLHLVSDYESGTVDGRLEPPEASPPEPGRGDGTSQLAETISRVVEDHPDISMNKVCQKVSGVHRQRVSAGLDRLVNEGYLTKTEGPRRSNLYRSVKPYQASDLLGRA
jgi:AAA domain